MRLEPLCRLSMEYRGGSWHRPYHPEALDDSEGVGFGHGDGTVSGEIEGQVVWANYPRRRQDGVWTPNLPGMIPTRDGTELLVSIHGQSVEEEGGNRRAILARIELTSDAEPYRWLNTCFVVGEGEIDEDREAWWLDAYVCVHDQVRAAPAIG